MARISDQGDYLSLGPRETDEEKDYKNIRVH